MEDKIIGVLNGLIPLIAALNGLGLVTKYVPIKALGYVSDKLIPVLTTLITFFAAFGGFTATANASIFGDIANHLTTSGKFAASMGISIFASGIFEHYLRPLMDRWGIQPNKRLI